MVNSGNVDTAVFDYEIGLRPFSFFTGGEEHAESFGRNVCIRGHIHDCVYVDAGK